MKVSICITTYNHEEYISQALDSVLAQATDFEFEILLGEDDSSDNTRTIVKKYQKMFPEKIRLYLNDRKNVIYINGMATGRWNFINNINHARGDYIALLEGDDYWVDNLKLKKTGRRARKKYYCWRMFSRNSNNFAGWKIWKCLWKK